MGRTPISTRCIFIDTAVEALAMTAGPISDLWPRLHSGERLVTLAYVRPIKLRREFINRLESILDLPATGRCTIVGR